MNVPLAAFGANGDDDDTAGEPVGSVIIMISNLFSCCVEDGTRKMDILTHQEASWANSG